MNCDVNARHTPTEDAVATCVDCAVRRDSRLEVWRSSDRKWVRKAYHSKYNIGVEVDAYQILCDVVRGIERVRVPKIYSVDWEGNSLDLEFVRGRSVACDVVVRRLLSERSVRERLLEILVSARGIQAKVDLDPQNIIVEDVSGDLVIIDPLWHAEDLPDASAVVFFVGLLKCLCRGFHGVGDVYAFLREWSFLRQEYLEKTGTKNTSFNGQMALYIDAVVAWNLEPSDAESAVRRLWRRTVLVPSWRLLALLFRSGAN